MALLMSDSLNATGVGVTLAFVLMLVVGLWSDAAVLELQPVIANIITTTASATKIFLMLFSL
jgi:hypothetical protein